MLRHLGGAMGLQLATSALFSGAGDSNSTAPTYILESLVPGFGTARTLIWSYTSIDITYIVTWCLLLVFLERGGRYVWEIIYESLILKYCVSTVSIAANERLNDEVLSFMSTHVVSQGSRFVAAQSARTGDDRIVDPYSYSSRSKGKQLTKSDYDEKTPPVKYFPALGTHWFWFRGRPFMFQRGHFTVFSKNTRSLYTDYHRGGEPLVIMCFGRDLGPLKDFVQHCKDFAAEAKREMTTIHIKGDKYRYPDTWGQAIARPARPLGTINMDEKLKSDIVADVDAYMHPSAREFYASRGIPFRRGYLFYGPPGTGKTSFSLALAGHCKLDLYMLSLANGSIEEDDLTRMFASLPPRCVVLLEDIDSAGIKRETEDDEPDKYHRRGRVSLSGLLNAIDGTSSQEGRLLIMTSNNPDALDKALVRPGRIDRKVYFGPINRASAEQIFIRMFTSQRLESEKAVSVSENGHVSSSEKVEVEKELEQGDFIDLSKRFAESIPEDKFTPAELQGFLLANRLSPTGAVENIGAWVETELAVQEEEREKEEKKKKKAAAKKKTKKALAALEKLGVASDGDSDADGESVKSEDLDEELEEMQNEELLKKMAKSGMSKDKLAEMTKVLKMGGKHGSPDVNGVAVETEAKNSELTNGAVEEVGKISESTNGEDTKTGAEDSSDIPHTNGFANAKPKEEKHIIGDKGFAKTIADLEEEEKGKNASRRLTKATKKKLEAEEKAGEKARKTQ